MSITNKDSLTALVVSLVEKTLTGNAYMTLPQPYEDSIVVNRLTQTLRGFRVFTGDKYNRISPDTFTIGSLFEPDNEASIEPPNTVRKPFLEIKFDSVKTDSGRIAFDSARIIGSFNRMIATGFVDKRANDLPVNFVKGIITVDPILPSVTVTSPNGGEAVSKSPCPPFSITWNATDNVGVTGIEIWLDRTNGGASFELQIANLSGNPGSYDWAPTGQTSTNAKIKVIARDAAGNSSSDVSDGVFSIISYCSGRVVPGYDTNNDGVLSLVDAVLVINSINLETNEGAGSLSRDYIEAMLTAIFSGSP